MLESRRHVHARHPHRHGLGRRRRVARRGGVRRRGQQHARQHRARASGCACRRCGRSVSRASTTIGGAVAAPHRRVRPHGGSVGRQGLGHGPLGNGRASCSSGRSRRSRTDFRRGHPRVRAPHRPPTHRATSSRRARPSSTRSGPEHMRTGAPIVYTSADSVFQIAAHEEVIPIDELYRDLRHRVRSGRHGAWASAASSRGRSSASPVHFTRTSNRRDFALEPFGADAARSADRRPDTRSIGIGKIEDLFAGRGITRAIHTTSDDHGMDVVEAEMARDAARPDLRQSRRLRHAVRPPQRRRRLCGQPRALRRAAGARCCRAAAERSAGRHGRSRQRSDDAVDGSFARARAGAARRRRRAARRRPGHAADVRRSGPDAGGGLRRSAARRTARASSRRSCDKLTGSRSDGMSNSRTTRSARARLNWRRRPRRAPPAAAASATSRRIRSGRPFSAIAIASFTARRSAGSSTRRRCSSRRPAITTARA